MTVYKFPPPSHAAPAKDPGASRRNKMRPALLVLEMAIWVGMVVAWAVLQEVG